MAAQLHLDGLPEQAVTLGLLALLEQIKKARKANEGLKLDTHEHDELEACAKDLLEQLGYVPPKRKGSNVGEVTRDEEDPKQGKLPLEFKPGPRARITCNGCRRRFGVPVGDQRRKCPDCGIIHHVVSDEDGTVFRQRTLIEPPDEILALFIARDSADLPPLNPADQKTLDDWIAANPDHTLHGELVEKGDRLADPDRPGSGNPLEIVCDALIGNGCPGFFSTDTPGDALCPKCGQKWTVEILTLEGETKPSVVVKPFDPQDGADRGGSAAA